MLLVDDTAFANSFAAGAGKLATCRQPVETEFQLISAIRISVQGFEHFETE